MHVLQDAPATLDRPRRSDVLGSADDQYPFQFQGSRFDKHLSEGPSRKSTAAGRWSNAVPNVATLCQQVIVQFMSQSDGAKDPIFLRDPSIRAVDPAVA
jgi:hypothetical protein